MDFCNFHDFLLSICYFGVEFLNSVIFCNFLEKCMRLSSDMSLALEATWVEVDLAVLTLTIHFPYSHYKDPKMELKRQFKMWECFNKSLQML